MYRRILAATAAFLVLAGSAEARDMAVRRIDTLNWPTARIVVEVVENNAGSEQFSLRTMPSGESFAASRVENLDSAAYVPILDERLPATRVREVFFDMSGAAFPSSGHQRAELTLGQGSMVRTTAMMVEIPPMRAFPNEDTFSRRFRPWLAALLAAPVILVFVRNRRKAVR